MRPGGRCSKASWRCGGGAAGGYEGELEGLAVGRLIHEFWKRADEPKLVGDLKGLVQDRNRCAHVAVMEALIKAKHHSENSVEFAVTIGKLDNVYMRTCAATGRVHRFDDRPR